MIADRRATTARARTQHPDRCPCPRPFGADFAGCPTFQPVSFVAVDSLNRALDGSLTCRHLTVGSDGQRGRFYPRCGLGSAEERQEWLAGVRPERVAVAVALQEELDAATAGDRDALHAAKADLLAAPQDGAAAQQLDRALRHYLATIRSFVLANRERLEDVGLEAGSLLGEVEDGARAWATQGGGPDPLLRDMGTLVAPSQVLPAPTSPAEWEWHVVGRRTPDRLAHADPPPAAAEPDIAATLLLHTPSLRVVETPAPPRLHVAGVIDAGNADAFAGALALATDGHGDRHLDAGGVVFCDVAGLRALAAAAERLGAAGARLVLHQAPTHLRRALAITGWDALPGLAVVAEPPARL